jgi:hypothetical protein
MKQDMQSNKEAEAKSMRNEQQTVEEVVDLTSDVEKIDDNLLHPDSNVDKISRRSL